MFNEDFFKTQIDSILKLFSDGQIQEALNSLNQLSKEYPNDSLLSNIRGACYAALGKFDLAIKSYNTSIELNPEYAKAHYNLAGSLYEVNNLDGAIDSYQKSIIIDPSNAQAHNNLGNVFKEIGQNDNAFKSFRKALDINPDYIEANYSIGALHQDLGQLESAVHSFKKVLLIKPNLASLHNNLGNILRELGNIEGAIDSYEAALSVNSDFAEALNNLGIVYFESGKMIEAATSYKKAISIEPNFAEAHNNLGNIFKENNQISEAISSYQKAVSIRSDFIEALYHLGISYYEYGDSSKAILSFEKALAIEPDYEEVIHMLNSISGKTSNSPPRGYVEKLFDGYAEKFDKSLVDELGYKLPFQIAKLAKEIYPYKSKFKNVIDLGCGTGLSGEGLKLISNNLIGVDISNKMIIQAKKRKLYDLLFVDEILNYLDSTSEKFDLFVALDVLIYIGDVTDIFKSIAQRSMHTSYLIFSIELQHADGFKLLPSGRYSHSKNYIIKKSESSFKVVKTKKIKLRKENDKWIFGQIFILKII